ncbi:hypothetical protein K2173_012800 [Erythroxylum novogranatense]|uniref:ER membrane protein complex subunit 10 n=1 Tax=Erythroxylum novogranatense TaxID=1862640 RepID=A0AAV8S708_9ROSI|nr:hypothetical protein K2173_012800 [Erythroxylum novogranatense]
MVMMKEMLLVFVFVLLSSSFFVYGFHSDELVDDEEFGLEGGVKLTRSQYQASSPPPPTPRTKYSSDHSDSDSKIQFSLDHAFGDSDFVPAGTFSARLKTLHHGGQTLTKLRFSRSAFTDLDKQKFEKLLNDDDFYRIRLPSNVLSAPGKDYVVSSVKARCLPRGNLDELFVINMDGANVLAVNYGAPGACPYPRQMKIPTKWSFNSHAVLKTGEQAARTPLFAESSLAVENGEVEGVQPPERSFWAKYWMYLIPLGLIVMNAITQAMNMAEEQVAGQSGSQPGAVGQRGPSSAVRRR